MGFPGGSDGKESACIVGDLSSIPGLGRSPRGRHGNPLQYSCLEKPHGHGSLEGYSPWCRKGLDMTEQLSLHLDLEHRVRHQVAYFHSIQMSLRICKPTSVKPYHFRKHAMNDCWTHPRIFPTQGSNPGFPHCRQILYHLSHQGSSRILEWTDS